MFARTKRPDRAQRAATAVDAVVTAQTVVVGCGVAGMSTALGLVEQAHAGPPNSAHGVVLLSKSQLGHGGSSPLAQGGIAAAVGRNDSAERHAADTLAVGAGLADPAVVRLLTNHGAQRIQFLLELGAQLDRNADHSLALTREAGHSCRRVLHARDQTGAELVRALVEAVHRAPVAIADRTFALDLVVRGGRVVGLLARGADGRRTLYRSQAVVLATGGLGRLFARTTNPAEVTGDGLAMAARAGARLIDLEFVQFHPTALASGRDPMPLLTEALRGEGALLRDEQGHRFMLDEHPDAELAPRDVVARAIWRLLDRGGKAFLDARQAIGESFAERFPGVYALCRDEGLDPRRDLLPVAPAAHYHMGGIEVDARGRTSLPGLWAAGEDACTGAHGANRLASNSLLEALVFGQLVADDIRATAPKRRLAQQAPVHELVDTPWASSDQCAQLLTNLRQLMWDKVGLVRDRVGLESALSQIEALSAQLGPAHGEARNMLDAAHLVTTAALRRRESRGAHYRRDYPQSAPGQPYRISLQLPASGVGHPLPPLEQTLGQPLVQVA